MSHTAPENTANTTLPTNTSTSVLPKTHSSTSAPTPEPPKTQHTTATVSTQSTSASSTGSSQEPPNTDTHKLTSPHTPQSDQTKSTVSPPSSPSAQAKAHVNTPSQLNVGGDSKCIISSVLNINLFTGQFTGLILTEPEVNWRYNKGYAVLCFPAQASPRFYTHRHAPRNSPATSSTSTVTTKHSTIIPLFGKEAVMRLKALFFSCSFSLSAK